MEARSRQNERLLLVESDPKDLEALRKSFDGLGFDIEETNTVSDALARIEDEAPNLVLSELSLPDGSGFALCRRIRSAVSGSGPLVVLVSRWSGEDDRILAFECGADDVISKPFFSREVASRVRAVLRRAHKPKSARAPTPVSRDEDFEFWPNTHEVRVGERRVALTPKEFSILEALLQYQGRVLTRDVLISRVWTNETPPGKRSVDAHVKNLRRKLGLPPTAIETIRGHGYRFSEKPLSFGNEAG